MAKKRKTEKPPAIDKLLYPVIGATIAFLAYYCMKGLTTEITRIDVTDELALREVFFGEGQGQNYVVLCNTLPSDISSTKPIPISSVFQDAADELSPLTTASSTSTPPIANFRLLDCETPLPSKKTVAQRFKLDTTKRPTVFFSGKVGTPKQIPAKHLKTGKMLVTLLKHTLEPHAQKIESTKDLKVKCLNQPVCALLLKGHTPERYVKDAVKGLLRSHPDVPIASIDSATMLVLNLEEKIPEFKAGTHRFVVFKKVSGGIDAGTEDEDGKKGVAEGRLITSMTTMKEGESLSFNSMSNLINTVEKSGGGSNSKMLKLTSLPQVKTRTKKLEASERKKRERIENKKTGTAGGSAGTKTTPSGMFTENDGSKEGRKAERDRRRQEQQKNNPNYKEMTPEQKAEVERRRRERMAEEEAKWNIAPDDAPEEGELVDEEDGGYEFGDEEEEEIDLDGDEEDANDEDDFMDLD